MTVHHAFEFLPQRPSSIPDVVAVFGGDATLRTWVLWAITGEGDVTSFDGDTTRWVDLTDDLCTASLFDFDGKRTIIVRDADKFVSQHRGELEAYAAKPGTAARLVIEVSTLPSNTRLYKELATGQMVVGCGSAAGGKSNPGAATRRKFLTGYIAKKHRTKLAPAAADALVEMLGDDIGTLETEIAKLALYLDEGETIDEPLVREVSSGWQSKTVWQITDAIAAGDAAEAIRQLDKLIAGGQHPAALLPQIAWSLRRLGMATAVIDYREATGRAWKIEDALAAAKVKSFELHSAKKHLAGMGRARGRKLLPWLLDADLRLKGSHSADARARFMLESLVLRLAR